MKTTLLITAITLSTTLFSQEIKSKISLAGEELLIYQEKQLISKAMILGGAGLAAWGAYDEEVRHNLYLGGIIAVMGIKINIHSLINLRKSAKYMIND